MFKIKNYKKILQRKFSIPKAKPNKNFKSFYGTELSGLSLIIFFYVVPIIADFGSSIFIKSQVVENNSKKIFKNTLEGKAYDVGDDLDTQLNIKNLFDDIFDIN